jgi:pimeloyl-ACP methyl ester carboxylesterase
MALLRRQNDGMRSTSTGSGPEPAPGIGATAGPNADPSCHPVTPSSRHPVIALPEALGRFEREATRGAFDTGRYRCRYWTWGEGPGLLCIPGLATDVRCFIPMMARLAGRFRCISYELPGGKGDGARLDHYGHSDLVADVFGLLDHLRARQSYVYGFSFGSTIALAAMRARPERLPRAVLQGGFARRPLTPAEVFLARACRHWRAPLGRIPFFHALLRGHSGPFAPLPPKVWRFYLDCCDTPSIAAVAHRALLVHRLDLRPILPAIRQPVLLVCGDIDPVVNGECQEELLRGLPNAGHIGLDDCGHYPLFTHTERLAEMVGGFLTPCTGCE